MPWSALALPSAGHTHSAYQLDQVCPPPELSMIPRITSPPLCAFAAPRSVSGLPLRTVCVPLHPQGPVKGQASRGQTGFPFVFLCHLL